MAKRNDETRRANGGTTTADAMEQRVVAFAEQLGRIARRFQAKAGGWLDRDTLTTEIAGVRDAAAELLEQLAGGATKRSTTVAKVPVGSAKARSGGVVDAPGKKHRKPIRTDPDANIAASQAAKMRMAKTMVKTQRRRGRG